MRTLKPWRRLDNIWSISLLDTRTPCSNHLLMTPFESLPPPSYVPLITPTGETRSSPLISTTQRDQLEVVFWPHFIIDNILPSKYFIITPDSLRFVVIVLLIIGGFEYQFCLSQLFFFPSPFLLLL